MKEPEIKGPIRKKFHQLPLLKEVNELYVDKIKESKEFEINKKLKRLLKEEEFMSRNWDKFYSLTDREVEILRLILQGKNNPEIAEQLFISRFTVEQHRKNLNTKLEIKSIADLFKYGYAFGVV